jgi:hypothetical protein
MRDQIAADDSEDAMKMARLKLQGLGFNRNAKTRKKREKTIRTAVDGRTLKTTGRTDQLNVRVRPEIKALIVEQARLQGCTIVDLVEMLVEQVLGEPATE